MAASATGWLSKPVFGRELHSLKSSDFSRGTVTSTTDIQGAFQTWKLLSDTEVTWTGAVRNRYDFAMSCRRIVTLIVLLVASLVGSSAAKPRLKVAADGFPTGQATPEGAASDLARAFIVGDAVGFRNICIRAYGGGQARVQYSQYLNGVSDCFCQLDLAPFDGLIWPHPNLSY